MQILCVLTPRIKYSHPTIGYIGWIITVYYFSQAPDAWTVFFTDCLCVWGYRVGPYRDVCPNLQFYTKYIKWPRPLMTTFRNVPVISRLAPVVFVLYLFLSFSTILFFFSWSSLIQLRYLWLNKPFLSSQGTEVNKNSTSYTSDVSPPKIKKKKKKKKEKKKIKKGSGARLCH